MTKRSLRTCVLTAVLGGAVLAGAGCATRTQAEAYAPVPEPLHIPLVPPRTIATPPPPAATLPAGHVDVSEASRPAEDAADTGAPSAGTRPEGAAPKPAPPPPEPEADAEAEPEAVLRTPETRDERATERQIQEALRRANADLDRLAVATLGDDAKRQYENARGFIKQAETFLARGDLPQAHLSAEKAEDLARSLNR